MPRGKPIDLSSRSFHNQSEAAAHFKGMLNRYKPGDRVNGGDALYLASLLERHTEYADKVGGGVDHFEVMMTEHGTQCFRIVRHDGSGTDFSYLHCIKGRPPSRKQEVSQAMRRACRYDLYEARDAFYKAHRAADGLIECAVTGERIPPDQGHMDHRPPLTFEVIVTTFLEGQGLSFDDVPLTSATDEQVAADLTDTALSQKFQEYHRNIARLDFVKNTVNLAQSMRERLKPTRIKLS